MSGENTKSCVKPGCVGTMTATSVTGNSAKAAIKWECPTCHTRKYEFYERALPVAEQETTALANIESHSKGQWPLNCMRCTAPTKTLQLVGEELVCRTCASEHHNEVALIQCLRCKVFVDHLIYTGSVDERVCKSCNNEIVNLDRELDIKLGEVTRINLGMRTDLAE